jgi:hypothetical protein
LVQFVVAIAIVAIAMLLRLAFSPVDAGIPYITFFPASLAIFYFCDFCIGAKVSVFILTFKSGAEP